MVVMIFVICLCIVNSRSKNAVWLNSTWNIPENSYSLFHDGNPYHIQTSPFAEQINRLVSVL